MHDLEDVEVDNATVLAGKGLFVNDEWSCHETAQRHNLGGTDIPPGANPSEKRCSCALRLVRVELHMESSMTAS